MTEPARGNRPHGTFDLAQVSPGDVVTVVTARSTWHLVFTYNMQVNRNTITGVAVMTNSNAWGRSSSDPRNVEIDRVITLGNEVRINSGNTGPVQSIKHNKRDIR